VSANFRNLDYLDWEFEGSDSAFMVHNACWYPAKLVPQIPAHLILNLSEPEDIVLDPFCGSGTTLIESLRHGRRCIGTDVNPIAIFIARAKCQFVGIDVLKASQERIYKGYSRACTYLDDPSRSWLMGQVSRTCEKVLEEPNKYIPNYEENRGWFHPTVLNKLAVLKELIWEEEPIVRDTLALAFFSILRDCSSLPIRKPYTYIADNVKPKPEDILERDVLKIYLAKSRKMLAGRAVYEEQYTEVMKERGISPRQFNQWLVLKKADARHLAQEISTKVDCVVTSPPYMGVTDNAGAHRLWYLWHDFGSTLEQDKALEIGPRWKRRKRNLEQEYIEDICRSLQQIVAVLKDGAYLCLIIGEPQRVKASILHEVVSFARKRLDLDVCRTYSRTIHKKWFAHPTGGVPVEHIAVFQKS